MSRRKNWHIFEDKKVCETPVFDLHRKRSAPQPDAGAGDFYVLKAPEWINVIALTPDQEVILVEQYRHGTGGFTLEIPGGMVDEGEEPLEAAKRELAEETGYASGSWSSLGKVSSNPAIMNNYTHFWLAKECRRSGGQQTGAFEEIDVRTLPLPRFLEEIRSGRIHHAIVVAAAARLLLAGGDEIGRQWLLPR